MKLHKSKKAILLILAIVLIVGGLTTACKKVNDVDSEAKKDAKPTATAKVQINEDDSTPTQEPSAEPEIIESEPISLSSVLEELANDKSIHRMTAPSKWEEKISADANMDIYVDASVDIEIPTWNILEMTPVDVDQEYLDGMIESLVSDCDIYLDISKTNDEINQDIDIINDKLAKLEDGELKTIYQKQLEIREQLKKSKKIPFNTKIDELGYIDLELFNDFVVKDEPLEEVYKLTLDNVGLVDLGGKSPATIQLDKKKCKIKFDSIGITDAELTKIPLTIEDMRDAERKAILDEYEGVAYQLIEDMGYNKSIYYPPSYCYINIDGGEEQYLVSHANSRIDGAHFMDAYWLDYLTFNEWLDMNWNQPVWALNDVSCITDKEKVLFAEVYAPRTEVKHLSRSAKLLEIEDIMDIFKKNIVDKGNLPKLEDSQNSLHIDGIHLSYMFIEGPQYKGQILLVPVWEFYGKGASDFKMEDYNALEKDVHYGYLGQFDRRILRINAVDGTVINN